jgi:hypothetical protein
MRNIIKLEDDEDEDFAEFFSTSSKNTKTSRDYNMGNASGKKFVQTKGKL